MGKLLIIIWLQLCISSASYVVNTTNYYQMPKLFEYDDFDECFGIFKGDGIYCIANVRIQQNFSSVLYNYIMDYSSDHKHHYRHDKLKRGLCVNNCQNIIGNLTNKMHYFTDILNSSSGLRYFNAENYQTKYDVVINKCINMEMIDKYDLKGFTKIEYCIDHEYQNYRNNSIDSLDKFVAAIIAIIVISVISSSLYDRYLRNTLNILDDAKPYYQNSHQSKIYRFCTLFSIRRNWHILSSDSKEEFSDLRIFQFIKTVTFFFVTIGHSFPLSISFPSYNPIYIEEFYKKLTSMFLVNGNNVVQTFFFISGFLSAYLFLLHREKDKSPNWLFFIKAVIFRYLRLVPLFLLMTLIHATWLYHLGDGPFWDENVLNEREFCRESWWINLLLLNNYFNVHKMCMLHTWYISADFWLSVFAYLYLIIIIRFPSHKAKICSLVMGSSVFITGYVIYCYRLDPIAIVSPEFFRNHLIPTEPNDLDYFGLLYVPTHMNLGNFFIGILTGMWYRDIKASKTNIYKNFYFRITWYFCIICGISIILSGYIFYQYDFEKPSIWISLAAILIRHGWGVAFSFGFVGVIHHCGWFTKNVMSYKGFKVFGRISYAAFICHMFILKMLMMNTHQMIEISVQFMLTISIVCFVLSNFMGIFLTICIEIPIASALKMIVLKRSESVEKFDNSKDGNEKISL